MSLEDLLRPAIDAGQRTLDGGGNPTDAIQEFIKHLDVKGGGTWWPLRSADFDESVWGDWEAWEFCVFQEHPVDGAVGARPTGEWMLWNAKTGQNIVFQSRKSAEMMAVRQNERRPTRVVSRDGSFEASTLDFDEVKRIADDGIPTAAGSEATN